MADVNLYNESKPDAKGYKEYSFVVHVNGRAYPYQVQGRTEDEALERLGDGVAHDFPQVRELGSPANVAIFVATLAGGVALGAYALRRFFGYLLGEDNKPAKKARPKPVNANDALMADVPARAPAPAPAPAKADAAAVAPVRLPVVPTAAMAPDPFPWTPVNVGGAVGRRAGPSTANTWRVVVFTDGSADRIRAEFVRNPEINPQTGVSSDGVQVYQFPLSAIERVRMRGPGVVEVAITSERPPGDLGLEIAASEESALQFLIQYFDFIR